MGLAGGGDVGVFSSYGVPRRRRTILASSFSWCRSRRCPFEGWGRWSEGAQRRRGGECASLGYILHGIRAVAPFTQPLRAKEYLESGDGGAHDRGGNLDEGPMVDGDAVVGGVLGVGVELDSAEADAGGDAGKGAD